MKYCIYLCLDHTWSDEGTLIHKRIQSSIEDRDKPTMEKVAILQEDHTLEHAMLVLTNVRYSLIPVLNKENKIVGLISSLAMILHKITGVEQIHMNQSWGKYKVRDVDGVWEFPIISSGYASGRCVK